MRDSAPRLNEDHRYFPEWADRPEMRGPPLEADHNSYPAGGYSEEFGYRTSADRPPVFPSLEGDPDESGMWRVHMTGLHPGYPECPRPEDRERLRRQLALQSAFDGRERLPKRLPAGVGSGNEARTSFREFRVIRVGVDDRRASPRGPLSAGLASIWARLTFRHQRLQR